MKIVKDILAQEHQMLRKRMASVENGQDEKT